jgi:hypothetical protein
MGKFKEYSESLWDTIKGNSGMLMIVGSLIVFAFGCFFLIAGAYIGATFTTQIEQGAVIAAGVAGGLLILFSMIGCMAYRKGHGFWTWFLFITAGLLALAGIVLAGIVLDYLRRIAAISANPKQPPPFPFSQNITNPQLQEVSDYINSIYVTCCTGCTVAVCGKQLNGTTFCPNQLTLPNPPCGVVKPCPAVPAGDPDCFFARGPGNTVPPFEIGPGICELLKSAAWGEFNLPVVGNRGTDVRTGVSCGGGDPKVFIFSVNDWINAQYTWISVIIGIVIFILVVLMIASLAYDIRERENYKPKKVIE